MAQKSPKATIPTKSVLEAADEAFNTGTTINAAPSAAAPLPVVVRSKRKAITIQNHHASAYIYWNARNPVDLINDNDPTSQLLKNRMYKWLESTGGTNEWYVVLNDGSDSDPSLSTPVYLFSVKGVTETSRSEGTASSLAVNEWDYHDKDSLGFNTIYFRPPAGETPYGYYNKLLSYDSMPAVNGATVGHRLGPGDAIDVNLTADARIFCISDTNTTLVCTIEYTSKEE